MLSKILRQKGMPFFRVLIFVKYCRCSNRAIEQKGLKYLKQHLRLATPARMRDKLGI